MMNYEEFEKELILAGLSKEDFIALFPEGVLTVNSIGNWRKTDRNPPYWVGPFLEKLKECRDLKAALKHLRDQDIKV